MIRVRVSPSMILVLIDRHRNGRTLGYLIGRTGHPYRVLALHPELCSVSATRI